MNSGTENKPIPAEFSSIAILSFPLFNHPRLISGVLSPSFPWSLVPCLYDATASCGAAVMRVVPLRGPRLRALMILIRSNNSCEE